MSAPRGLTPKTKPTVATPVDGLAPSEPLAGANPGMPKRKKVSAWAEDTLWHWFSFHTEDKAFKFRVSVALEAKRQSGKKVAVVWDSLTETHDGFVLQWHSGGGESNRTV